MAMERPHTRVISVILQHDVPRRTSRSRLHELHVATLSIRLVDDFAVPSPNALCKNVEVMAVEMHGVGSGELILDDNSDGAVGTKVVDIPLRVIGVREIALVGQDKDWVTLGKQDQQWIGSNKCRDETYS